VVHLRIDRNSVFGGVRDDLPGQAVFDADQVSLPVHEGLTDEDARTVVEAVRAGW
jgi:perosamine synthetase